METDDLIWYLNETRTKLDSGAITRKRHDELVKDYIEKYRDIALSETECFDDEDY